MDDLFDEEIPGEAGDMASVLNTLASDETDEFVKKGLKASLLVDQIPMESLESWRSQLREAETVQPLMNPGEWDYEENERAKKRVEGLIAMKEKLDDAEEV